MYIKLTRAWVSKQTGEYVCVDIYGNKGIETGYRHIDSVHMESHICYFDTAYEAFCAMEKWHEDPMYEEV